MIRESLLDWQKLTELLIRISDVIDENLRDGVVQQIEQILEQREQLKSKIQPPFTMEEQQFGQELLKLEKQLEEHLKQSLKSIRQDIVEQQKKKVTVNAYLDPYSKVFRDGTFYDSKK